MLDHDLFSDDERELERRFIEDGFVIADCEAPDILAGIIADLRRDASRWLADQGRGGSMGDLAASHAVVQAEDINPLRLHLFAQLNTDQSIRIRYLRLARRLLEHLVGNELAMQVKVNLSIQQPDDPTSVLDIHSDVWTGDSPFQVVLWTPLTDTRDSNAMFFLPPRESADAFRRVQSGELGSMSDVMHAYCDRISIIDLHVGQVLVFNSNCLHGNRLNETPTSRWSLNCRFTSLLAPATNPERRLGTYYTPITIRPATRVGIEALRAMGHLA